MSKYANVKNRFDSKFIINHFTGCWLWVGAKNRDGYGSLGVKGKTIGAHRVSYVLYVGQIPNKMSVLHKCDVRNCVNPDHLFLGTQLDNVRDMFKKKRNKSVNKFEAGEKHRLAILNFEIVAKIREEWAGGATSSELGKKYKTHPRNIRYIVQGKTWKTCFV